MRHDTWEERSGNVDLLVELISKQSDLKQLNLSYNYFTSIATQAVLTTLANSSRLETFNLEGSANFDSDEPVEKLAEILQSARYLKEINISGQIGSRRVKAAI